MRLGSTVCTNTCCSFTYICDICGHQRLTSEPIPPGQRTAAKWPGKSGYNPRENAADSEGARYILDNAETATIEGDDAVVRLDVTALDASHADSDTDTDEDLARDFTYRVASQIDAYQQERAYPGIQERYNSTHQYLSEELD